MCWCWWSERTQSKISPIWCLQLIKAVIINKTDRVDVFSGWSCFTCAVWKPVCTKGLYKSRPYWSATGAFGSVWPKRSARADVATDNFFNKLLRVEIEKIDPGAPPGTWRPKLIWKNVWGNQSEIYEVDTIGILFECGKKNTECNMVSIKMIPFVDTLNWLVWKWFKFR